MQLRVLWAEPIAVSSRYTGWNPLVLTPVCAGSLGRSSHLKFSKAVGLSPPEKAFSLFVPSAVSTHRFRRCSESHGPGAGLCLGLFWRRICLPVLSPPTAELSPELRVHFSQLAVATGSAWAGEVLVGLCSTGGLGALQGSQCGGLPVPPWQCHSLYTGSCTLPQPQGPAGES